LCLTLFPWAQFRRRKSAVKLHTLLDLRGSIPTSVYVTGGQVHDVNLLDQLLPEPGAFYLLDRGYLDFARLYLFTQACAYFITRAKHNTQFYRRAGRPVDRSTGLRSDQTIGLTGPKTARLYPAPLRRIHCIDAEKDLDLIFLTNNFLLPALTIAQLYRARWRVELFFRWIKQHLHLKAFYGTSPNAVKTQVWVAVAVYVLVAILKKQLPLDLSLYKILQILSLTLFEKTPILQGFSAFDDDPQSHDPCMQLQLFHL
jgi:transposase